MPEPLMQPETGAVEINKPTPAIQPAGVTIEGYTPQQAPTTVAQSAPQKDHFGFLRNIDWVDATLVIAAIVGIAYAVHYYSTQIKTQNGVIATLSNDVANLQTSLQNLQQTKKDSANSVNASGGVSLEGIF